MKIIFLLMDTVRRDFLSFYGNTWVKTPNLDRLAAKSVVFDNHWVGSLPCMPARRELMTGNYNLMYRGWGPMEVCDDALPRLLRQRGIFTHLLTDHQHYFEVGGDGYHTAYDTWEFFRGQEYDQWVSLVNPVPVPEKLDKRSGWTVQQNLKNRLRQQKEEDFSTPRTCKAAAEWLEANKDADNWFLHLEVFDPHEPYTAVQKYYDMYGDTWKGPLFDWPEYAPVRESPEAVEHARKEYAAVLSMADHAVGVMLDKLEELGLMEETVIVFTTDHGTLLGEHGFWEKAFPPMYNEIARIPLTIHLPGHARAGQRVSQLTQTLDLMPTILDLAGVPLPGPLHGKSVLPTLEGRAIRDAGLFGHFGAAMNLTDGHYVYMRNPVNADGGPLFAYTSNPVAGLNSFFPRDVHGQIETGRYFSHTHNMPLYRIPARGHIPWSLPNEEPHLARHQLFDVRQDPGQLHPVTDKELEAKYARQMAEILTQCEAQPEQFARLGLTPPTA